MISQIRKWLLTVCVLIVAMVCVGGTTRLTGSGLSIVEWKPIMGAIPPLNETEWTETFQKYQASPQYQLINQGMSLHEFKKIFFWEYVHRLLGRLIGFAFFVPWVFFVLRKALSRDLMIKTAIAFALGGLQGFMGWFMVKSGLVNEPRVSHFRLAAHLLLALVLLVYLFKLYLSLDERNTADERAPETPPLLRTGLWCFAGLLLVQITYGAFVAGMRAGFAFNTFPTMAGHWIPPGLFELAPAILNWVQNPTAVQFAHRMIAWALLIGFKLLYVYAQKQNLAPELRRSLGAMLTVLAIQFVLGIATLVNVVPIPLAVLHQLGAFILALATMRAIHFAQKRPSQSAAN